MPAIQFVYLTIMRDPELYEYNDKTTQSDLYKYVRNQFPKSELCYDKINPFEDDQTSLFQVLEGQLMDLQVFVVIQSSAIKITAYFDGYPIEEVSIEDKIIIRELLFDNYHSLSLTYKIAQIQLSDKNYNLITNEIDQDKPFSNYLQGYEQVKINLLRGQIVKQESQKEEMLNVNIISDLEDPLKYLIVLSKISLMIDPNGQCVPFKFHLPLQLTGQLKKSQGKDPSLFINLNVQELNWIPVDKIKYARVADHEFAVIWEDGTMSQIFHQ